MTTATLEIGQLAPGFRLKGEGGQPVSLEDFRGTRNVVLVFYPLAFSPVCSHQLPAIQRELDRIQRNDAVVLGVSVDSHWSNTEFARKLGLSFQLLSDFKREASTAYGVLMPEAQFSARAIFVVDKQGRLAYRDVSPATSEVPSNERLIQALEGLR